jgi:hypothetical protein
LILPSTDLGPGTTGGASLAAGRCGYLRGGIGGFSWNFWVEFSSGDFSWPKISWRFENGYFQKDVPSFFGKECFFFRGDHFKKRILKRLAKMDFHLEAPISPVFGKQYQTMRSWPTEPLNQLVDDNYNEI